MSLNAAVAEDSVASARSRPLKVFCEPSFSLRQLIRDFAGLWDYRDLIYSLSIFRIKVRYKQSLLGVSWAILQPVSLMLIYTVVFSVVARMPSEHLPYAVFTYAALLPWLYFSAGLTGATTGISSNAQFVTKVYFPREILPISYVVASLFDFFVGSSLLAGLMLYYRVPLTRDAFYALPILVVLTVFTLAVALLLSATQVWFRDFGIAMPLLMQLWMFASPVVYPLSAVPAKFRGWYILNPMVGVVENLRRVMLQGLPLDWHSFSVSASASFILLPACYLYFRRIAATMADVV
jgi:lipopolysaccharide transport system permease protein